MSASLKHKLEPVTPTAFQSPERAGLGAAIVAAAGADARRAALEKAVATADEQFRAARRVLAAAEAALEEAGPNAIAHARDVALGVVAKAPVSVREARAGVIAAADDLETAREMHKALVAELADEKSRPDLARQRVEDAVRGVICREMAERATALAAEVAEMQQNLVARGSALTWLSRAGVFPMANGKPKDDAIRNTLWRLEVSPNQWALDSTVRNSHAFAFSTGRLAWEAAFEQLLRDANAPLPAD